MKTLLPLLVDELAQGRAVALATVVKASGSVPRGAGACMLVTIGGTSQGTVGGGVLEYRAQTELQALLSQPGTTNTRPPKPTDGAEEGPLAHTPYAVPENSPSRLEAYTLTQSEVQSLGMVCGGQVTLLYQLLTPIMLPFFASLLARVRTADENLWLSRRLMTGRVVEMAALNGTDAPYDQANALCGRLAVWQADGVETGLLVEPVRHITHAYLFGGGHVSQCVAPLLAKLDFNPVVYDDRPAFANRALFPDVTQVHCAPFAEIGSRLRISTEDEVVIMTRGHVNDTDTLLQALRSPAYYIGLIGSRSKIAHTKSVVLAQGFTEADFARVHTPVGLPIQAETPMEIAVSIAAEMIRCRAERAMQGGQA
jgi:xanthine dehydrogenase accessory factor